MWTTRERIEALRDLIDRRPDSEHAVRARVEALHERAKLNTEEQFDDLVCIMFGWIRGLLIGREVLELCAAIGIEDKPAREIFRLPPKEDSDAV